MPYLNLGLLLYGHIFFFYDIGSEFVQIYMWEVVYSRGIIWSDSLLWDSSIWLTRMTFFFFFFQKKDDLLQLDFHRKFYSWFAEIHVSLTMYYYVLCFI